MSSLEERLERMRQGNSAAAESQPVTAGASARPTDSEDILSRIEAMRQTERADTSVRPYSVEAEKAEDNAWDKIKNFVGFTGEKAASGALESVEGSVNALGYIQQLLGKGYEMQAANALGHAGAVSGNENIKAQAEKQQKEALEHLGEDTRTIASFGDRYAEKVDEKYDTENRSKAGQFVGNVAQGIGGMVPAIISNAIIPGSGLAVMSTGAIGNATQEAKKKGADDREAFAYGLAVGAVEAATEKLLGGMGGLFGKGALDDAVKGLISGKVKSEATQAGLNTLVRFLGEGAEEFIAEYGNALANRLTIDTERRTGKELLSDAFYNGLVGGAVGGLLNAADIYRSGGAITATEAAEAAAAEMNVDGAGLNVRPAGTQNLSSERAEAEVVSAPDEGEKAAEIRPDSPGLAKEEILVESGQSALNKPQGLAYMLASNISQVSDMEPVKALNGTEMNDRTKKPSEQIRDFFAKIGNSVFRKGFGEVLFNEYGVGGMLNHRPLNRAKMVALSAAPEVIQNGRIINDDPNWKGRGYRSITFAAPVTINGNTVYVAAVVDQRPDNKFYLTECVDSEGNYVRIKEAPAGNTKSGVTVQDGVTAGPLGTSNNNVTQPGQEVNINEGIYGQSVGAATPAVGPMVETQNKAITENINLGEESRAANQPAAHEQISEALSLARAGAQIMVDGEGNIVGFEDTLDDLLSREKWSGVDSDTAQLLLKDAEKRGDAESVKRIAERMAKEGTEAAQLLQSRQKWINATPANRLAAMYNYVDEFAKGHKAVKGGKIEIPDALAEEYLKAATEGERDEVISKIQEHVASQARSTLLEKWTALRYVNMLGNFKTQIRNISGNLFMQAQYFAKNETAALIEAIANVVSGGAAGRSKSFAVGREWMQAAKADFANAKDEILSNGKYSGENFKGEFAEGIEDARKILPPGLEQYRRATNWAMETGDVVFSKTAYARALAGYLKANGIQPQQLMAGNVDAGLLDKARAYAINQAQEATFRDNNAFSDWVSRIGRRPDTPKAAKALAEGLLPFRRTPANVLMRAEEFSPLGLINTAVKAVRSRKAGSDITASDIIDSLSKSLTGSGLMALGYILADQGLLRASGSDEDEEYDALMNIQDWSIVIPGMGTYTFDWAAPASLIMFIGAQLSELMSDGELSFADVEGALTGLSEPLIQMSMLSGVNDTLDSIKYSDNNLIQMAGQLAVGYLSQGLTNTLLGQIERSTEAERMSTYTEADSPLPEWLQRSIGKASAKTPGVDYQQTEYLNEFGETEESAVGERVLENLFSPGYFEAEKSGGVYDIVSEMRDRLGVDTFPDAYPPDSVKYDKESFVLSQEERSRYQETRGQAAADYLEAAGRDGNFKRLTSRQQRDILEEIMGRANDEAKNEALENRGVEVEQSATEKVIERMTAAQYIDWLVEDATTRTPVGYKSTPTWQEFEKAAEALPDGLAISMMIAKNEKSGGKISEAVRQGVALDDAVAYYRAITEYNSEGKTPGKAEKQQRIAALGLSWVELDVLGDLFG